MRLRATTPEGREEKVPARRCDEVGCSNPTRERKEKCPEHVLRMPYVAELAQRAADDKPRTRTRPGRRTT